MKPPRDLILFGLAEILFHWSRTMNACCVGLWGYTQPSWGLPIFVYYC